MFKRLLTFFGQPSQSSIDALNFLYNTSNVLYISFLALTLLATVLTVVFGWRLNKAKDEQYSREKQASDERIAVANAEASKASEGAARANEELAKANERIAEAKADAAKATAETERLTQENLKLSLRLEQSIHESRDKQRELAEAQQRLADAQERLAKAQQRQAEAELALQKALEEVRRRQQPRTLSSDQRIKLIEALKTVPEKGPVTIVCPLGDAESTAFATEIDSTLKAAGWPSKGVDQAVYTGGLPVGFGIVVKDTKLAPRYAAYLQDAFAAAGVPAGRAEDAKAPEGSVTILIGIKP